MALSKNKETFYCLTSLTIGVNYAFDFHMSHFSLKFSHKFYHQQPFLMNPF